MGDPRQKKYLAKRADKNQPVIVRAFRQLGCSVTHTHEVGHGFVDIVVGVDGFNALVEIKDGSKPPSRRKLTPDESDWHALWRGQKCIIESVDQVFLFVQAMKAFAAAVKKAGLEFPAVVG